MMSMLEMRVIKNTNWLILVDIEHYDFFIRTSNQADMRLCSIIMKGKATNMLSPRMIISLQKFIQTSFLLQPFHIINLRLTACNTRRY